MTAESAAVLPVLVLFAMGLVWGLLAVGAQLQCVDAARTGARAAARQDPADAVVQVTREAAPEGATVTVSRGEGQVRVVVVARPPGLGGLPFDLREEAVAAAEEAPGDTTVASVEEGGAAEKLREAASDTQRDSKRTELTAGRKASAPGGQEGAER